MIPLQFNTYILLAIFLISTGSFPINNKQTKARPTITIATNPTWEVSGQATKFGEYPLSAEQIPTAKSPLYGWTTRVAAAEHNGRGKIVPGSMPIWRNRTTTGEGEGYQFRKNVYLGADPFQKITLEINCDDVARVYINKRLVSVDKRDGKLKDGYDDWFLFRSVTGFMYDRIYTYDVTDYFYTNVTNTIFVEAVSLAFDGSHAYISAKFVIEFAQEPKTSADQVVREKAKKPAALPASQALEVREPTLDKEKIVFEAGHDPEIAKLRVGSILELGHVYFKADQYQLDSASYRTLSALATFMQRHPALKIEVGGHTNLRPNDQFAAELSANRAQAVMRYLTDNGVAADRLTYKGYGKSQPRIKAKSKDADRANQRVEVKVLEK